MNLFNLLTKAVGMSRKLKSKRTRIKKTSKLGLAPGSAVFTGQQKMQSVKISVMQYREGELNEFEADGLDAIKAAIKKKNETTWVNIDGLHDVELIRSIGSALNLHKLTIEDIVSVGQRPKIEEYDGYIFVILRMFMSEDPKSVVDEQLSFVLSDNVLLTFQEVEGDVFNHVRTRIREGKGSIRSRGADYLLYALIDSVIDYYFLILENLGERLEDTETHVLEDPHPDVLREIHQMKREVLHLRRSVYPLREVISKFERLEEPVVGADTRVFIRDLYDHTIQVIESIEVFRDMASSMVDMYMNSISNNMNNVMKVLTIIATIFIPLTFIAGVYGMNFEHMPELAWRWGYVATWVIMILIAGLMVVYFKRKKWF